MLMEENLCIDSNGPASVEEGKLPHPLHLCIFQKPIAFFNAAFSSAL